jgi:hypothetical protein
VERCESLYEVRRVKKTTGRIQRHCLEQASDRFRA